MHIDGEPPEATDCAHLVLRNTAGDYAQIPWNIDGQYGVHVVPGTYDLFYAKDNTVQAAPPPTSSPGCGAGVGRRTDRPPRWTSTSPRAGDGRADDQRRARRRRQFRHRVAAHADGDRVTIANTARATYATRVVPGTYDLYYTRTASPTNTMTEAPANHAARLRTGVVVAPGPMTVLDVDIPSTTVSGTITVNGAARGRGRLRDAAAAERRRRLRPFAFTNAGTYTARLIPGTYDLYFSNAGSGGDTTPMNTFSRLRCFGVP